tara:strand:- start:1753 stop:1962 length:210 start_codon:yes stop_codon:yes gene_type:complete
MKWCSLLDNDDLEEMKKLREQAIDNKKTTLTFQSKEYKIDYIDSVLNYIEDFQGFNDIGNYKEPNDLIY